MKKSLHLLIVFSVILFPCSVLAATNSNTNDPAYDQARQDYRAYLEQLKTLQKQYHQITDEVKKIVAEEGVPTWDENSDQMTLSKNLPAVSEATIFGDADIQETEKTMIVKLDLPGLQKDKINIKVENNQILKISGSRETEKEIEKTTVNSTYSRLERQHGAFERSIKLPAVAQDSGIEAKYENGVLTVTIPKIKETKKEVLVPVA